MINRDKAEYYSIIINDSSHNPKKQGQILRQILYKCCEMILPPHQSDSSLATQISSLLCEKNLKALLTVSGILINNQGWQVFSTGGKIMKKSEKEKIDPFGPCFC